MKWIKEKATSLFGSFSGGMSIISAHNACHTICMGLIAILTLFGVIITGMPLGFLQDYNLLFWSMGLFFLLITLIFYIRNKNCISSKMIMFNAGLIVVGTPFPELQKYDLLFWAFGGSLVLLAIILKIKEYRK